MTGYGKRLLLSWLWLLLGCRHVSAVTDGTQLPPAHSPLQATYLIDGRAIALHNGRAVLEQVDGATARTEVWVLGEPVWGDLDDDGVPDVAVLLVVDSGGSGTFYYLAAAYNRGGAFIGSDALFLGDRIAPQRLSIRYGLIVVDYAERLTHEAMTTRPSQGVTKYLVSKGNGLEEIDAARGEGLFFGEVLVSHEVRSFKVCGGERSAWLLGDSPALPAIKDAFRKTLDDPSALVPLFMVLTGRLVERPADGYGADYPSGFYATRLVLSRPGQPCVHTAPRQIWPRSTAWRNSPAGTTP